VRLVHLRFDGRNLPAAACDSARRAEDGQTMIPSTWSIIGSNSATHKVRKAYFREHRFGIASG